MTQDLAGRRGSRGCNQSTGELHPPQVFTSCPPVPPGAHLLQTSLPHGDSGVPCGGQHGAPQTSGIQESRADSIQESKPIHHYQGSLHTLQGRGLNLSPFQIWGEGLLENMGPPLGTGPHSPPNAHDCKQPESQASVSLASETVTRANFRKEEAQAPAPAGIH